MRLITAPAAEPVSLGAARRWARIDDSEDDETIALCIQAAREKVEHTTGLRLLSQVWALSVKAGQSVQLHGLMPVQKVVQGDAELMVLDGLPAQVTPLADGEIRVTCGYPDAAAVPSAIKMWILQRLGYYLENRQALVHTPGSGTQIEPPADFVDGLLDPYIVPRC